MARRRARRRNPSALQLTLIGLGVVSAAGVGYGVFELVRRQKAKFSTLPPPPEATPLPSGCGRQYPGFVFDGSACVPGPTTPAGIYVNESCTDFTFVRGDTGSQPDLIEQIVVGAATSTADPEAPSADPTKLASSFLAATWPSCSWPPKGTATPRIQQLYVAMVFVIGREILIAGGRVLGTTSPDILDEQITELLEAMGLPEYDPDVVPEIDLPDSYENEIDLSVLHPAQLT